MWSIENKALSEPTDTTESSEKVPRDTGETPTGTEETRKSIEAELLSGEIPNLLRDELRIVPLESPAGQLFQDEMETIARRLHEHWDVAGNPIRFFLMDLPGVNACQIKGANPPLIGFTKGCFIQTESEGFKKEKLEPLTSVDEIALILGHEQVHLNIEKSLNRKRNSKLEEALANYQPIEAVYRGGFNPAAGLSRLQSKVLTRTDAINWNEIIDVHPIPETSLSIMEAALTQLNRKYGDISRESTALDEHSPLKEAAATGVHTSTLEVLLHESGYDTKSPEEKVRILEKILRQDTHLYSRRFDDFKKVVNNFRKSLRGNDVEKERILTPLFDATIEHIETRTSPNPNLETLLSYIAPYHLSIKPMGRLQKLDIALKDFIQASDYPTASSSAERLLEVIKNEPLCNIEHGRNVLKKIAFSQFSFPDVDKLMRGRSQRLSWNNHIQFANRELKEADSPIVEALLAMGIHEPRLYSAMKQDIAVDFFTGRRPPLFRPPHYSSSEIGHLTFAEDRAVAVVLKHESIQTTTDGLRLFYTVQNAQKLFNSCMENLPPHPKDHDALVRLSLQMNELNKSQNALSIEEQLLGLAHIEKAPELFVQVNEERLEDRTAQNIVKNRLLKLKEQNPDLITRIGAALSTSRTQLSRMDQDAIYLNVGRENDADHRPISSSPLLSFLLKDPDCKLSMEERQSLVSRTVAWEGFLDAPLVSYDIASTEKLSPNMKQEYRLLLKELSLCFPKESSERITQIQTWNELDTCITELQLDTNPLGKEIVLIHSLLLYSNREQLSLPETAALERILDIIIHPSSEWEMPERDITTVATKMIGKITDIPPKWSSDLRQACREWKTFYQAGIMPHGEQDQYLHDLLDEIANLPKADKKRQLYELLLDSNRHDLKKYNRIKDPDLRARLADNWSQAISEIYGKDDMTEDYVEKIFDHVTAIESIIPRADQKDLLNRLSKAVMAQEQLSKRLGARVHSLTEQHFMNSDSLFMGIEGLDRIFQRQFHTRSLILQYLAQPVSEKTLRPLIDEAIEWEKREATDINSLEKLLTAQFKDLHKNFWALPLEVRTLLMKEILTPQNAPQSEIDNAFQTTLDLVFPDTEMHSAHARKWVNAYISATPQYAQHLLLSALLVAGQKSEDAQKGTGFAIASFLESMGPAETKAGQAAQGHPQTPEDIRDDLIRLKTHADEPSRWELFSLLDDALDPETRASIHQVGNILGSASLFIAVEITTRDGDSAVLSLLRPNGCERAQFGFGLLEEMITNFDPDSQSFQVMRDIIRDSKDLIEIETNTSLAQHQRDTARSLYNNARVFINEEEVNFHVPSVVATGKQFIISEKAPGPHFIDLPSGSEREKFAKAILALELNTILSGLPFDNDRHGGNCRIEGNTVYHFDFGGMMLESPSERDLQELTDLVLLAGSGASSIDEFVERYFSRLREKTSEGEEIAPLLKRAQKALLSLAEYSHDLTPSDLKEIIYGAIQTAHPIVKKTARKALLDLPFTEKLALLNPFKEKVGSKIRIVREYH